MRYAPLVLLCLAACRPSFLRSPETCPEDYVPIDTAWGEFNGRAMSAAGVVIAVRQRANHPQGSLDFWTEVVRREMTEGKGYAFRSAKDLTGGRTLAFSAPSEKNTAYVLALFVNPKEITTVEIAGPKEELERDLPRLEGFITKLRLS